MKKDRKKEDFADIAVTDVCKSYGDKKVLVDFSRIFECGKTYCICGESGAGKTTLLRLIMRLEKADSGQITGLSQKKIAAVFQEDRLLDYADAVSNIRLVNTDNDRSAVISAMNAVGLTDCENQPVTELSGGMRRRVAILRAVLSDFDLLLLDEPFKGLDEHSKELTVNLIKEKTIGKTVIIVSHDISEAAMMSAEIVNLKEK